MTADIIYKVFKTEEWRSLKTQSTFAGSADDLRDGFIHFSTRGQLQGTLDKYYADAPEIIIAAISTAHLGEALQYESSRGGQLFPHLYAPLTLSSVIFHTQLRQDKDAGYDLSNIQLEA